MNIALLTCDKLPKLNPEDQLLIPELAKHQIQAKAVVWDDPNINWTKFDWLIFRNTWDYFEKESAFNHWLDQIENLGIKTLNPIATIRLNKHKFYLRDLEQQGIATIPTLFIDKTPNLNLSEIIPSHWKKVVIKPAFSGGSYQTTLFNIANTAEINDEYKNIASEKELLVQEFMPEIQEFGETSFIFFNKKLSHCVNKKPTTGDFRVQIQFGGQYTIVEPANEVIQQAQRIINTFDDPLLYARVDGIVINNELHLMEVECIEPDLYFNLSNGSQSRFVAELVKLIG